MALNKAEDIRHKKTSLRDVAREVGVSASTVSRILNNAPNHTYSDELVQRVFETVEKLGYTPNLSLRNALKQFEGTLPETSRRRTNNIALILEESHLDVAVPTFDPGATIIALSEIAREMGFNLLITIVQNTLYLPQPILEESVDAVILTSEVPASFVRMITAHVPVVTINTHIDGASGAQRNHVAAFRTGIEYLVELGHKEIALCYGHNNEGEKTTHEYGAIISIMKEAGIKLVPEWIQPLYCDSSVMGREASEMVRAYLEGPNRPTAIIGCDMQTFWVYHMLREQGIKIPQEISLVIVGNGSWAELCDKEITLVADPDAEMWRWVMEEAVRLVETPDRAISHIELFSRLVKGVTTAPPLK
jgi:DNA-binding LacI/PurR family transcriptional regulator